MIVENGQSLSVIVDKFLQLTVFILSIYEVLILYQNFALQKPI